MSRAHLSRWVSFVLAIAGILFAGFAHSTGPVTGGSLPGGVTVQDNDNGNGQKWGRGTGRDVTYTINTPAEFGTLTWGITSAPHVAFDNAVDSGGETMTNVSTAADYSAGRAVFAGNALLPLANGSSVPVNTRFTMTVRTLSNTPIQVSNSGGPSPGINVLPGGAFRVNLFFEMQWNGSYGPLLDTYDPISTPAGGSPGGNVGPVISGVTTGFFYTDAGMTLEDHDTHITNLINASFAPVNFKLGFLYDDWIARIGNLQGDVGSIKQLLENPITQSLSQIQQQVAQLAGQNNNGNPNDPPARQSDVRSVKDQLNGILMVMIGLDPCPASMVGQAFCDDFKSLRQLGAATNQILIGLSSANSAINTRASQGSVDGVKADTAAILIGLNQPASGLNAKVDGLNGILIGLNNALQDAVDNQSSPSLDMVIAPIDSQGSKTARWIVKISRDGELVPAVINAVSTIRTGKGASVLANVMGNTTIVTLAPGLYEVTVNLVKDVSDGSHFVFQATAAGGLFGNAMGVPFK